MNTKFLQELPVFGHDLLCNIKEMNFCINLHKYRKDTNVVVIFGAGVF